MEPGNLSLFVVLAELGHAELPVVRKRPYTRPGTHDHNVHGRNKGSNRGWNSNSPPVSRKNTRRTGNGTIPTENVESGFSIQIKILDPRRSSLPVDPKAEEMIAKTESLGYTDIVLLDPKDARKEDSRVTTTFLSPAEPVEKIENHIIEEGSSKIPVRIYWPKQNELQVETELYPMIIFFHGGGWVLGNLDLYDELCAMLCNKAASIVLSVDYRFSSGKQISRPLGRLLRRDQMGSYSCAVPPGRHRFDRCGGRQRRWKPGSGSVLDGKRKGRTKNRDAGADLSDHRSFSGSVQIFERQVWALERSDGLVHTITTYVTRPT